MKINILIIVILTGLISCKTNNEVQDIDLIGNWSAIYEDSDRERAIYQELYFNKDTMEVFDLDWELHLPYKYDLIEDSIYLYPVSYDTIIRGKISMINPEHLLIDYDTWETNLTRINSDDWQLDSLIKTGIYNRGVDDSVQYAVYRDFVENHFWIREIKCLIYHGKENKDSLIHYWKSALTDSTNHDKHIYKNLLKEFDDN